MTKQWKAISACFVATLFGLALLAFGDSAP